VIRNRRLGLWPNLERALRTQIPSNLACWAWDRLPPSARSLALQLYPLPRYRVGVLAIVMNASGEVLLLRHRFRASDPWGPPGGWLEAHENPRDGLAREVQEELGLAIDPAEPELLAAVCRKTRSHLEIFFRLNAEVTSIPPNVEFSEGRYFPIEALPDGMYGPHRELVRELPRD
jgi:ADP-ribose pyrophosphatase YjhB (NUDIX family)